MANATKKTATTKNAATKKVETKKSVAKTVTKPVAKTEVKAIETKKTETKNVNKVNITMDEVEKMFTEAGIGFKHNNCNYRIITGGSSLNVHKREFAFYMTNADFDRVKSLKATDIQCTENGNSQDKARPNTVIFNTVETLKMVLKAIAPKQLATA